MGAVTEDKFIDIMLLTRIKPCVHLKFTKPIKQSSIFTCIVTFHIVSTTIVYNNNTTIDTYLKCGCAFVFFTKLTFTSIALSSFILILSSNVRYMVKPVSTYNIRVPRLVSRNARHLPLSHSGCTGILYSSFSSIYKI